MATINKLEVTALDPDVTIDQNRHSVPQAGQTYEMPVDVNITGDLTVTGSYPAGTGDLLADGTVPLTANWDVGSFDITADTFIGNLTGNASGSAATVTSIGNLTGHITSTNRATLLGSFTVAQLNTAVSDATLVDFERRDIAFSDETSDLTTGDNKATFHMPNYATTLLEVSVGMTTAPTGSTAIFDLTEAGTTVLSTLISIDAGEKTSETAATPPVISDSSLAANALMSLNVDQIGSSVAGTGGKLYLKYKRA